MTDTSTTDTPEPKKIDWNYICGTVFATLFVCGVAYSILSFIIGLLTPS